MLAIRITGNQLRAGRALVGLSREDLAARALGGTEIVINAHPTSLTFYLANGYRAGDWSDCGPPPCWRDFCGR